MWKEHGVESFLTKSANEYIKLLAAVGDSAAILTEKTRREDIKNGECKCHSMILVTIT